MAETVGSGSPGDSCPDCRALVADLDAHIRWHRRLVADLATAIEKDIDRRAGDAPAAAT